MGRHEESREIREEAAKIAFEREHATKHEDNGEEDDYKDADGNRNFIANFTKALEHHPKSDRDAGEVINQHYKKLLGALKSGKPSDFENLTLGPGGRVLTNPRAGLAFDLEGPDSHDLAITPAPRIDSSEAAGEMAELYWMALCRDVPFNDFEVHTLIGEAVADLSSNYSDFPHPFPGGTLTQVTPNTIFRGVGNGVLDGPYISQFLYKDIPKGYRSLNSSKE